MAASREYQLHKILLIFRQKVCFNKQFDDTKY